VKVLAVLSDYFWVSIVEGY